ncbi:MAG: type II secretion system F family protein [Halodesulfurarchaeum sp.]
MIEFLPLFLVGFALVVIAFATKIDRLELALARAAVALFGPFVEKQKRSHPRHLRALRAAHVPETYRVYASKTYLYASLVALALSVSGVYAFVALGSFVRETGRIDRIPETIEFLFVSPSELGAPTLFSLLVVSAGTAGILGGMLTYQLRWTIPRFVADDRRRHIDSTIKRNVAFVFALSRSGMPFPAILRILSRHRGVYGETAREVQVAVRDMDLFGADLLSALDRLGERTPNEELEEFAENLKNVLRSGRSIPTFLKDQYDYFLDEEESHQRRFIELLGTIAETYVTVFVAGFLFLFTVLFVIGLLMGGTLRVLQAMVYLVLPLATVGFIIYLDTITEELRESGLDDDEPARSFRFSDVRVRTDREAADTTGSNVNSPVTDGGNEVQARNWYRLSMYRRLRPLLGHFRDPVGTLTERPWFVLLVAIPLGIAWVLYSWWPALSAGTLEMAALDDGVVQALIFVTGSYAITYEIANRRIKRIEAAIPDLLDRLAGTNEAGMSIVESFDRVVTTDLGALTGEMRRTRADVEWGARVESALHRFQTRVETPAVIRVVTLLRNAMKATSDIGPVLRIAADEAKAARRLERDRRNELLAYVVVIYVAFLVFLVIVIALDTVFVPAIPTTETIPQTGGTGPVDAGIGGSMQGLTDATKESFRLLLFHAAIVQGYVSGFVAGQMGDGRVRSGAKHATVMLLVAYLFFLLLG